MKDFWYRVFAQAVAWLILIGLVASAFGLFPGLKAAVVNTISGLIAS